MARILIGTSGYSYRDWVGPVYPPGTPPGGYLGLYAERFDFVEIDSTYYRQPEATMAARLLQKVRPGFSFAVKAHRSLTHEPLSELAGSAQLFREGIAPLHAAGRLSAVLLQFPFSFHYAEEQRRHLDRLCRELDGLPLAVEFRNRDWHRESVLTELRRRDIAFVSVDLPPLAELPPPEIVQTSSVAYVRFHGRNSATWWTGDAASRYDYCYSAAELDEWTSRMLAALKGLSLMIVAFNNHYRGQAVKNAIELRERLASRGGGPAPSAV